MVIQVDFMDIDEIFVDFEQNLMPMEPHFHNY